MAFLVQSLFAEDASTPMYQVVMTVRNSPKARMAMVMPRDGEARAELVAKGVLKE